MRIRVLGQFVHTSIAVLAVIEAAVFVGAFNAAALFGFPDRSIMEREIGGSVWLRGSLFSIAMVITLVAFGLYTARQRARVSGLALRIVAAVLAGLIVITFAFSVVPNMWVGHGVLAIAAVLALGAVTVTRLVFHQLVDESLFKRRIVVYGAGRNAGSVAMLRRRSDRRGFTLAGFILPEGEECSVAQDQLLEPQGSLADLCVRDGIDEVVVAMDDRRRAFPVLDLLNCRLAGIEVTELLTFLERETGRVRIDVLNPSWMIFGDGFRRDSLRRFSSRTLDLLASSVILLLTFPFMLVTVLAIKIEEGLSAPVFYAQERVGLGGRTFKVLKFRSMRQDAERDGKAQWATKGDSRVTRVGAFIRKCRIDELPQILCVFRGHMSFVGPRPERPQFVAHLSEKIPYYVQRHCVKPGITGWAQLCYPYGSSEQDALEKLQYDLYYIKNNSLLFDLWILLQTVEVVVMGQGAR